MEACGCVKPSSFLETLLRPFVTRFPPWCPPRVPCLFTTLSGDFNSANFPKHNRNTRTSRGLDVSSATCFPSSIMPGQFCTSGSSRFLAVPDVPPFSSLEPPGGGSSYHPFKTRPHLLIAAVADKLASSHSQDCRSLGRRSPAH